MSACLTRFAIAVLLIATSGPAFARQPAATLTDTVRAELDLPYAATDNPRQQLDLYLPKGVAADVKLPLVVYIHGGGWQGGDKRAGLVLLPLVQSGQYALASVGYRLTNEAIWPAQIHDCKAAIRWIRGHARELGLDPDRIGVTGGSAGGHLAMLIGTSGNVPTLDGNLGDCTDQPCHVACVVNYCGPSDLHSPLFVGENAKKPDPAVVALLGGPPADLADRAKEASPVTYVTRDSPPVLTLHGTKDLRVDFKQAEIIDAAYKKAGAASFLVPVVDAGHAIPTPPELLSLEQRFWDRYLRGVPAEIATTPIGGEAGRAAPAPVSP